MINRESTRSKNGGTRFEIGSLRKLKELKNKMRMYQSKIDIYIVQPGIDSKSISQDMLRILSATSSYLLDTYGINLKIICS